jgi:hypothetical protein
MNYNIFFLFSLLSWICYIIELPPSSIIILWQLYFFTKYLKNHYDELDELDLLTNNDDINNHNNIINYEDKYLQEIRKFNKNWVFSDDDLFNEKQLTNTLFDNRKKYLNDRLQFLEVHINNYVKQIEDIKKKIDTQKNNKLLNYDNELDNGLVDEFDDKLDDELYYELENNLDCEFKCEFNNELHYKLVDELNYELNEIYNKYNECNNEYNILKQLINDDIKILEEVENIAHSDIIKNKIQRLENCYVIEIKIHLSIIVIIIFHIDI